MEYYSGEKDYIMHESRKEDNFTWESSVRLALVGREEDIGMYLEEREGRKRKWQGEGKMMRRDESDEKEQRKVPPKKIMAALSDMGGSGTSSSSSHMSPGWQVNDLDLDLPGELSMNEALLSLPSLAVFKQEAPSPTGAVLSPPRRPAWPQRRPDDRQIAMESSKIKQADWEYEVKNLCEAWRDMRRNVKRKAAHNRSEYRGYGPASTGNGRSTIVSLTPAEEQVLSVLGPVAVYGMEEIMSTEITNMVVDNQRDVMEDSSCQQSPPHNGNLLVQHDSPESMQCQPTMPPGTMIPINGYHSPNGQENKNAGLLMCSPVGSLDGFLQSPVQQRSEPSFKDDTRFQYVLAAATSIATKQNEETLTYLNQGQPYEIKLKKLGDLSHYKGKILKSVIKICFHERRLQYMEREQIAQWHADRPGERILEVDVPLSYGVIRVEQPACLNALHVYWDPTKDVGVYIKVNCISTEFTAKKHGGEKGVPFRIQVETCLASDELSRLHAAACQIKVFKLKGADRKHKQDREKVMRRPRSDLDKYQPGCEATVLTTLSNDALMPPPSLVTTSPPYSPEMCVTPKTVASPIVVNKPVLPQHAIIASNNQMKPFCQDGNDVKVNSPQCHSPGAILPDLPQPADDPDKQNSGLSKEASSCETQAWLARNRFGHHAATFSNFSGADLLRLSRDDIIQICGLADGIRLFNALHAKRIEPRLTVYVSAAGPGGSAGLFSALYLHSARASDLLHKLNALLPATNQKDSETVLVSGPHGTRVLVTDELVRHLPDRATFTLQRLADGPLLLSATGGN